MGTQSLPLAFRVQPGDDVRLHTYDTRYRANLKRATVERDTPAVLRELATLQKMMFAAGTHSLLVVLQGMDSSGKDGVTRHVFSTISPTACRVSAFKAPTSDELARDFLWRVHRHTPARGEIAVFNRSHYEDVLIGRVLHLAPPDVIEQRYDFINDFERLLAAHNTLVVKFMLHISKAEQYERLAEREEDIHDAWKLNADDWENRARWDDYQRAYEIALSRCSTAAAPWYIVPADRRWFRNYAVARTLVDVLRPYEEGWLACLREMQHKRLPAVQAARAAERLSSVGAP